MLFSTLFENIGNEKRNCACSRKPLFPISGTFRFSSPPGFPIARGVPLGGAVEEGALEGDLGARGPGACAALAEGV